MTHPDGAAVEEAVSERIPMKPPLARELLLAWLHLGVLWTLAMAQPLLEILADEPAFFVARDNTSGDIVALALLLTLAPPTLLVLAEALLLRWPHVRHGAHLVFVAGLTALFVLQVISDSGGSSAILFGGAVALGGLFALAYRAARAVPSTLTLLSPAPLVLVVWFLVFSPVSDLVFPQEIDVAAAGSTEAGDPPIVFIVFDEFFNGALMDTEGRIDHSRYPNFADLARHSTWYRNATSVSGETPKAVPAIMTGVNPKEDDLPTAADHPGSIFTLLAGRYSMDVTEPVTAICPSNVCGGEEDGDSRAERWRSLVSDLGVVSLHTVLPERLRSRLPAVDRGFGDFGGQGRDSAAGGADGVGKQAVESRKGKWERFVSGVRPLRRAALHFYHSLTPHVPWQYLPSGKQYAVVGQEVPGLIDEKWQDESALVNTAHQRFLLQVGFVDRQIGRLIDQLRAGGLFDRSLIVVTADHGVSFRAGQPRRGLTVEHAADIANVPLFVKLPDQKHGQVNDAPVRTIDIVPTIADLLNLRPRWKPDGQSFLDGVRRPSDATLQFVNLEFNLPQLVRSRRETVRQTAALFGERDGGRGIFALGADRDLLGEDVSQTVTSARPGVTVEVDQASLLAHVDLNSPVLPVYLTGSFAGAVKARERVAIAVNSRIRAVTSTFGDGDRVAFAAMVPPEAFDQGANSVQLLVIGGSGRGRRLVKLGDVKQQGYRLVRRGDQEVIQRSAQPPVTIENGAAKGSVDVVDTEGGTVSGWAVDPNAEKAADRVVVFAGRRYLGDAAPLRPRPDLKGPLGSWATDAGFQVTFAPGEFEAHDVRVFALSGSRASEL